MPRIECNAPAGTTFGTRLLLDGREVPDVRDISIRLSVDSIATVAVEVIATERLDFQTEDGRVNVMIVAIPGYVIVEEQQPDGSKWYRAEAV